MLSVPDFNNVHLENNMNKSIYRGHVLFEGALREVSLYIRYALFRDAHGRYFETKILFLRDVIFEITPMVLIEL